MFVFHQEEETMNLTNKNNQYHIQITYGRMAVIVCPPTPYLILLLYGCNLRARIVPEFLQGTSQT